MLKEKLQYIHFPLYLSIKSPSTVDGTFDKAPRVGRQKFYQVKSSPLLPLTFVPLTPPPSSLSTSPLPLLPITHHPSSGPSAGCSLASSSASSESAFRRKHLQPTARCSSSIGKTLHLTVTSHHLHSSSSPITSHHLHSTLHLSDYAKSRDISIKLFIVGGIIVSDFEDTPGKVGGKYIFASSKHHFQ